MIATAKLASEDRLALGRLVQQMSQKLDGAVDTWTTVCASSLPNKAGFVQDQSDKLIAVSLVIEDWIRPLAQGEIHGQAWNLVEACRRFCQGFRTLASFPALSDSALREATFRVREEYAALRARLGQLYEDIGIEPRASDSSYRERILDSLEETLLAEQHALPTSP